MQFDYQSYIRLIEQLRENGYAATNYHNYRGVDRCVILRHDIDTSLEKAVKMAELENEQGIQSTYFVLLTSDFYNTASKKSLEMLHNIQALGHELGLHFDERAYGEISQEECIQKILSERGILSAILDSEVTTVSMHRPSKATLEGNLKIPGMINSYGEEFFRGFKYLSDSRRRWREPVEEIIKSGKYKRLHILTHAFWYNDLEEDIYHSLTAFIKSADEERYGQMEENITDLHSILRKEEL